MKFSDKIKVTISTLGLAATMLVSSYATAATTTVEVPVTTVSNLVTKSYYFTLTTDSYFSSLLSYVGEIELQTQLLDSSSVQSVGVKNSVGFLNTSSIGSTLLSAGSYTFSVIAYGYNIANAGSFTGSYNISTGVSAVPEAKTYGMFLAGLGLLGFKTRRRKQI